MEYFKILVLFCCQSLNSSRDELSCGGSMESLDPEESDPYSYYNRRPFHPLYGPK